MVADYTQQLKQKQLALLTQYSALVAQALVRIDDSDRGFISAFLEQEKAMLNRMDHLHRVIKSFPFHQDQLLDYDLAQCYAEVQDKLQALKERIRLKKHTLGFREKQYLLKSHRQNRLYREIKPSYIDIRT